MLYVVVVLLSFWRHLILTSTVMIWLRDKRVTYICWRIDICLNRWWWFFLRLIIECRRRVNRIIFQIISWRDNCCSCWRRWFRHFWNTINGFTGCILNEKIIQIILPMKRGREKKHSSRAFDELTSSWILRFFRDDDNNLYFLVHGRPGISFSYKWEKESDELSIEWRQKLLVVVIVRWKNTT